MAAENNYKEILDEVCEKINSINQVKEVDILNIKSSVESIESLVADTQAKMNFQEIKDKLEKLVSNVDNCSENVLKDLCNDISTLKISSDATSKSIQDIQTAQNAVLTNAEFEEFRKQQLDLTLRTNENIVNELTAIKENSQNNNNLEQIQQIELQLDNLHKNLTGYIEQITVKLDSNPNIDEINAIFYNFNTQQQKNIKETNDLLKEVQTKISALHKDFISSDLETQIAKISEIYDSLNMINDWIERVGYINQSIENVYARLGENIDFDDVSDKIDIIYENIAALNLWTQKIDKVDGSIVDVQDKMASLSNLMSDITKITETIDGVKNSLDTTLFENVDFEDLSNKMDIVYENISAINSWTQKIDKVDGSIVDVQDKLKSLDNVNDMAGKIEVVKQQLEKSLGSNVDFIDLADKVDIVYENISAINSWTQKIDKVDGSIVDVQDKITSLSTLIDDVKRISNIINELNGSVNKSSFGGVDFEDLSNKMDIVYENISAVNDWSKKIDKVGDSFEVVQNKIENLKNMFGGSDNIDFEDLSNKVDIIYDNISSICLWANKIDDIFKQISSVNEILSKVNSINENLNSLGDKEFLSDKFKEISNKISILDDGIINAIENGCIVNKLDDLYEQIDGISSKISESFKDDVITPKLEELSDKVTAEISVLSEDISKINDTLENDMISSKIDLIYENIGLLNEWVGKIDKLSQTTEELDSKCTKANDEFSVKFDEISNVLSSTAKFVEDVPDMKDKLNDLADKLNIITSSSKSETESYIYTLLDIESDFLRIHKFLNDSSQITSQDINIIKDKFAQLNDDISSISVRTNRLILSADDANKEFKVYLDSFKNTLEELDKKNKNYNPELKFSLLSHNFSEMITLLQKNLNANNNLNNAFMYLAEWIDATGNVINSINDNINEIQNNISGLKQQDDETSNSSVDIIELKDMISNLVSKTNEMGNNFTAINADDISDIKAELTGIIVQLNTALTPDIDSLNEKIDKLSEENNHNHLELETVIKARLEQQESKISSLEAKIDMMNSKFDTLIDIINNEQKNYEIKDILNYIVSQINTANENLVNQQNNNSAINEVSERIYEVLGRVSNVDENIEKLTNTSAVINEVADKMDNMDVNIEKISQLNIDEKITGVDNSISILANSNVIINEVADKVANINKCVENIETVNNNIQKILTVSESVDNISNKINDYDESMNSIIKKLSNNDKTLNKVANKVESFDENINKIVSYIEED